MNQKEKNEQEQKLQELLGIGKEPQYKCSCPSCKYEILIEETFACELQEIECPECGDGLIVGEKLPRRHS